MALRPTTVVCCLCGLAAPAEAYDATTSSTGAALHWETDVAFALALEPGPRDPATAAAEVTAAIATWNELTAPRGIALSVGGSPGVLGPHAGDGVNTIRWAVADDDPDLEAGLLARTFTTYETASGKLLDTDIVVDAVDFAWSDGGTTGCVDEYDLQNAITHEIGHALGLAHSADPEATMFPTGDACETAKRDLAADDVAGIAALYVDVPEPPDPPDNPGLIRRGCAVASPGSGTSSWLVIAALAIALRTRRKAWLAGAVAACWVPAAADAAHLRELTLGELAERAAMVVRVRVGASEVVDGPRRETATEVTVEDCLAGTCPRTLAIRTLGGEAHGVGTQVDGEARLIAGDELVLFVRFDRRGHARVVGALQGALHVERTRTATYVVRDLRGHATRDAAGHWRPGARWTVELAAFRRAIAR